MKIYTNDIIAEAMDRVAELKGCDIRELCDEANVKYTIKQEQNRTTLISNIIIQEFGHDMLIHWIKHEETDNMPEVIEYVKLQI